MDKPAIRMEKALFCYSHDMLKMHLTKRKSLAKSWTISVFNQIKEVELIRPLSEIDKRAYSSSKIDIF